MADRAAGVNMRTVIDTESAYNVIPGSPDGKILPYTNNTLKAVAALITDESLTGNRNPVEPDTGNIIVSDSIVTNFSESLPNLTMFKHLFGKLVTTGSTDPWTHTFSMAAAGEFPAGLVVNKEFTDISEYLMYLGCKIISADFEITSEGYLQVTYNILGASETRSGSPYDATPTSYSHKAYTAFQAVLLEGGSAITKITNLSFSVNNGHDEDGFVVGGGGVRQDLPEGIVAVTGSFDTNYDGDTLLAKGRDGTETSLKLTLTKSADRNIELFIPEIRLSRTAPEVTGPAGVQSSFEFQAFYDDSAEASSIQAIVKSGDAAIP